MSADSENCFMRCLSLLLGLCVVAPLALAGDDDDFVSENKAKSVRPALGPNGKPITAVAQQKGKKEDKAPAKNAPAEEEKPQEKPAGEVISADDLAKIAEADGKRVVVEGTIVDVYVSKNETVVNLNFGKNYKKCFKAVVFSSAFAKFDNGIDYLKKLKGKKVKVEGQVSMYMMLPQIKINTPNQIEVVE